MSPASLFRRRLCKPGEESFRPAIRWSTQFAHGGQFWSRAELRATKRSLIAGKPVSTRVSGQNASVPLALLLAVAAQSSCRDSCCAPRRTIARARPPDAVLVGARRYITAFHQTGVPACSLRISSPAPWAPAMSRLTRCRGSSASKPTRRAGTVRTGQEFAAAVRAQGIELHETAAARAVSPPTPAAPPTAWRTASSLRAVPSRSRDCCRRRSSTACRSRSAAAA